MGPNQPRNWDVGAMGRPTIPNPTYQQTMTNNLSQYAAPQMNNMQPSFIPGRIVQNPNEIRINEIPMDSNVSLFPMSDLSAIYAKGWSSNGTILTVKYIPEPQPQSESEATQNVQEEILARLDRIEKALHKKKPYYNKPRNTTGPQNNQEEK